MAFAYRQFVAAVLLLPVAGLLFPVPGSHAAMPAADPILAPGITSSIRPIPEAIPDAIAELEMKFLPGGDGDFGHIEVTLTPQNRALTLSEARQAAEEAFLEALNEPGLGDMLTQVRVVVYLAPAPKPRSDRKAFVFSSKNGNSWRLEAAETFKLVD